MADSAPSTPFTIGATGCSAKTYFASSWANFGIWFSNSAAFFGLEMDGLSVFAGSCPVIGCNWWSLVSDACATLRFSSGFCTASYLCCDREKIVWNDGLARFLTMYLVSFVIADRFGFETCDCHNWLLWLPNISSELAILSLKASTVVWCAACSWSWNFNWSMLFGQILGREKSIKQSSCKASLLQNKQNWEMTYVIKVVFLPLRIWRPALGTLLRFHWWSLRVHLLTLQCKLLDISWNEFSFFLNVVFQTCVTRS